MKTLSTSLQRTWFVNTQRLVTNKNKIYERVRRIERKVESMILRWRHFDVIGDESSDKHDDKGIAPYDVFMAGGGILRGYIVNEMLIRFFSYVSDEMLYEDQKTEGYENLYQVSTDGLVRTSHTGLWKILSLGRKRHGYYSVLLHKDGKRKNMLVHRLVAKAFIPNPNNYPYINHKDENPSSNHIENLEWCTAEYNSNYGTCKERIGLTNGIPVLKYDLEGNFISEYPTMTDAERNEGIDHANICICCEGKISHCNNFIWIYKGNEYTIQDRIKKVKNSITRPKKLEMYDRDGKLIRTYDSIMQASKTSGDSYMVINRQLKTGIITKNAIHIWKQV